MEAASDDDGWATLASVGHIITNQSPDFDSRTYGYAKLSDLMTATTLFEMDRRSPGDGKPGIIYARAKRQHRPDEGKSPHPVLPGGGPALVRSLSLDHHRRAAYS